MKKLVTILCLFLAAAVNAETVKLKITYNDVPVSDCDITIKIGDVELGSGRTNSSGDVSINAKNLISKSIDVYGSKKTANSTKTWNAKGFAVLDNSNYCHLKMDVVVKQMSEMSGMSEATLASMWGLAASGKNDATASSGNAGSNKSAATSDDDDDDNNAGGGSSGGGKKKGTSLLDKAAKVANAGSNVSFSSETHTSSSSSGPDGYKSSSSSSKTEGSFGGGKASMKTTKESSNTTFDDNGLNGSSSKTTKGTSFPTGTGKSGNSSDNSGNTGSSNAGSKSGNGKSSDNGSDNKSSGKSSAPKESSEVKKARSQKGEREATIEALNKKIVDQQSELMGLKAEKYPDTITIGYKSNDLENVKLQREREQLEIEKLDAKISGEKLAAERDAAIMTRLTEIEFRLKQLADLEKASKKDRDDEKDRREKREEKIKKEDEFAKDLAKVNTLNRMELNMNLTEFKTRYQREKANFAVASKMMSPEKKAENEKDIENLKTLIDKYEARLAELKAQDEAEKKAKEAGGK